MMKHIRRIAISISFVLMILLTTGCGDSRAIVSGVDEREANVIVVFLESKGIKAAKQQVEAGPGAGGGEATVTKFNIVVDDDRAIDAMAILNSNGLPHRRGTDLLELFAKQGLMSTDKEETIRYQAGLASQLNNMIMMIDGVIDASVQLSFPPTEEGAIEETTPKKTTAAVFVKHQGIIDDPNSHLETKIKRLVSGSINGLDINDVTVVSDRSRFTDVNVNYLGESLSSKGQEYVKIWSIVMSKESAGTFRTIFFFLLIVAIGLLVITGWTLWKMYPTLKNGGGINEFFSPIPFLKRKKQETATEPPAAQEPPPSNEPPPEEPL